MMNDLFLDGLTFTCHAKARQCQRSISDEAGYYIIEYGHRFHAGGGCTAYWLNRRAVRDALKKYQRLEPYKNMCVITDATGVVVTVQHVSHRRKHWRVAR